MAVEMHGVRGGGRIVNDDSNGGVRAEVFDIPDGVKCQVSFLDLEENGVVVVCAERGAAECPEEGTSGVDVEVDIQVLSGRGSCGVEREDRNTEGEVVVGACSGVGNIPGFGGGCFGSVGFVVVDGSQGVGLLGVSAESGNI